MRRAGIHHRAQFQVARQGRQAGRCYYLDFALPDHMVAIECDGAAYHTSPRQKAADARRQRELEALGWTFVRFTGSEINTDADRCAQVILRMLNDRENL